MSGSLAVFKIIHPNKEKLMKNELNSNPQRELHEFADLHLSDNLGQERSILYFIKHDSENNRVHYKATHYTDTIKNPIRIYLDSLEDTFSGLEPDIIKVIQKGEKVIGEYQEIYKFDVLIDFKTEEIFIFTKKKIANSLMRRFHKSGHIDYEKTFFDMQKIENIPELLNIWGLWEDCQGKCKKKAYFGTAVHTLDELNKKNVTSYNVEYEIEEGNVVDLFIMGDCRLSSKSKLIGNDELFDTYKEIKKHLGTSGNRGDFIEVFQEEN